MLLHLTSEQSTQSETNEPGQLIHFHTLFDCVAMCRQYNRLLFILSTFDEQNQTKQKCIHVLTYARVLLFLKLKILIAKPIFSSPVRSFVRSRLLLGPMFYMRVFNLLMCSKCHRKHDIVIRAHNVIIISLMQCVVGCV